MKRFFSQTQAICSTPLILVLAIFSSAPARAASAEAICSQTVVASLGIRTLTNMNFGTAVAGSAAMEVSPSNKSQAASFQVTGEPNRYYSITLPKVGTVVMKTGTGSEATQQIVIEQLDSFPSHTGRIGPDGNGVLYVGGKRSDIPANQEPGTYNGAFVVTVVY